MTSDTLEWGFARERIILANAPKSSILLLSNGFTFVCTVPIFALSFHPRP
jgi:hypothetical protein